ncbi:hypothetical protein [Streptomyces sp. NBC_01235]|uniref:hypothetical protein n=1 Tax=Streptomyces sp. NBC_01235 TaxID=2903788 RepID=UPI002E0DD92E|nr:hypothetical protein OG289_39845 [Streptomyces sp. NBC_01235]
MVAPEDIHAYDLGKPFKDHYRNMIEFLRQRYATHISRSSGDARFFRVDVTLDVGEVRLYFLKQSLYLQGWSVLLHNNAERYLAVDKTAGMRPQELADAGPNVRIPIRYTADAATPTLSGYTLQKDLRSLHTYLTDLLSQGNSNRPPPWNAAQSAFHRVVRMTAEMARFGGFCESFMATWPMPWPQTTAIDPANNLSFSWAVNEWDGLSKRAHRENVTLKFKERDVTQPEAEEIMGDGAPCR